MMPKKRPGPIQEAEDVPATELQQRFGAHFRALRKQLGLTQVQVSISSGIGQNLISAIESGKVNLTLRQMQRLAKAVASDVSTLLSSSPDLPSKN